MRGALGLLKLLMAMRGAPVLLRAVRGALELVGLEEMLTWMVLRSGLPLMLLLRLRASLDELGRVSEGYCINGIKSIHQGRARLREDRSKGENPQGSDIFEACRLKKGRAGYTRVCECRCKCVCRCGLLWINADDLSIDQELKGVP